MDSATATPTTVVIDPEFDNTIPPLAADELALLEESLVREGCREPLLVMAGTNILLDGHNRYAICTRLGIAFEVKPINIATRDEALLWIITNQLARRNLADIDRIALVAKREPILRAQAAARQATRSQLPNKCSEAAHPLETREVAAAAAGGSHRRYTEGKKVIARGTPELVQAVRDGRASIHAASKVAKLPVDQQKAIVAAGKVKEAAKATSNQHTKPASGDECYTPDPYLKAARKVLGTLDTDPASCLFAQKHVRAETYYAKSEDGLSKPWHGTIWLNPPSSRGLAGKFVDKLIDEYVAGNVTAAILLTDNETETTWFQKAASVASHISFPNKRIRFLRLKGKASALQQGQALFYFGPDGDRFVEVFGKMGFIATPVEMANPEGGAVEGVPR